MIEKGLSGDSGVWCVRRRMRIPAMRHRADAITVERALADIDGVLRVSANCESRWVAVNYLLTKTDYQSLERVLENTGFPTVAGPWARFRSRWYQNLDLTGRENAAVPPAACCNRPPKNPTR